MNILTFDIEEWFHILDNTSNSNVNSWSQYESRIKNNMYTIFEILEASNVSATFFIVGWIAEKYPEIVRSISDKGYQIGSHTHLHQLVYHQSRNIFYKDVQKSISTLENCTGKKVKIFRAPGFSITEKNKWAFEVLYELGIEIDASVFPAGRSHGGFPSYKIAEPSYLEYNGLRIKEFPINTKVFFNTPIIFSGGGYFRLMPYYLIKKFTKKSNYIMTYFHPRDFDFKQPILPGLSIHRKFKSYFGLKNCRKKLERWLADFEFIDLNEANNMIIWDQVPVVKI